MTYSYLDKNNPAPLHNTTTSPSSRATLLPTMATVTIFIFDGCSMPVMVLHPRCSMECPKRYLSQQHCRHQPHVASASRLCLHLQWTASTSRLCPRLRRIAHIASANHPSTDNLHLTACNSNQYAPIQPFPTEP